MMVAAAKGVDPNAQLLTLEQLAAMVDMALSLHLGPIGKRLEALEVTGKDSTPQEPPATATQEPTRPKVERTMKIRELALIFSLSHTTLHRMIQAGVLPYDRAPRGFYLLNAEEVWGVFQERYRVPGAVPRLRRQGDEARLRAVHESHTGKMLWAALDIARALGVEASTLNLWRKQGLAHYAFVIDADNGQKTFRYDMRDILYFLLGTTKELAEQKGGEA